MKVRYSEGLSGQIFCPFYPISSILRSVISRVYCNGWIYLNIYLGRRTTLFYASKTCYKLYTLHSCAFVIKLFIKKCSSVCSSSVCSCQCAVGSISSHAYAYHINLQPKHPPPNLRLAVLVDVESCQAASFLSWIIGLENWVLAVFHGPV